MSSIIMVSIMLNTFNGGVAKNLTMNDNAVIFYRTYLFLIRRGATA